MQKKLFKKVSIEAMQQDLHIIEDAEAAAKRELPPRDSTALDSTERSIVVKVEKAKSDAQDTANRELVSYRKRLINLNSTFRELPINIDGEIRDGKAKLNRKAERAGEDLRAKDRELLEVERSLEQFIEKNPITREPQEPSDGQRVLSIGIIAVLFLIETLGNASFLAKGNELGLFGAYTEAILISFVNLGVAYLLGRIATNSVYFHWNRKSVGILAVILFFVFAFFFNLMVAHYREITGTMLDEGGQLAVSAFRDNPLGLRDFQSWMLFAMGFLFAIISFIDGLKWDEPYPGYKKVFTNWRDEYNEYKESYDEHQNDLINILSDDAKKPLNDIKQTLMGSAKERASILEEHRHLIKLYEDHLDHLERAGNDLLMLYRETNRERRSGEAPDRFKERWSMERQTIDKTLPEDLLAHEDIQKIISDATVKIEDGLEELQERYNRVSDDLRRDLAIHRRKDLSRNPASSLRQQTQTE